MSEDFGRYWASGSSYPLRGLLTPVDPARRAELKPTMSLVERDPPAAAYVNALRKNPFVHDLMQGRLAMEWCRARMVSDDPAKVLGPAALEALVPQKLKETIGEPERELELISAYFVPTAVGVRVFSDLATRGVKISVLANALEETEESAVHLKFRGRNRKEVISFPCCSNDSVSCRLC